MAIAYVARVVGNILPWFDKGPTNFEIIMVAIIAAAYFERRCLASFRWDLEKISGIQSQLYELESNIQNLKHWTKLLQLFKTSTRI